MISNAYLCRLNVRGKTEQGLVGNSQALPLRSGYSVHSAFLRLRNCNSGIWFLSHSWCHTRGWLLLRTSWRRILPEPFRLYSFPFCIVHLRIRWPSRGQRRKTDTLFSTLNDHDESKKKWVSFRCLLLWRVNEVDLYWELFLTTSQSSETFLSNIYQ